MNHLPMAQLNIEAWIALGAMFVTIVGGVATLSLRFGKLEQRVVSGFTGVREKTADLESWVKDIASGQTATCAKHAEKISHLEHATLRLETDVSETRERVTTLEVACGRGE